MHTLKGMLIVGMVLTSFAGNGQSLKILTDTTAGHGLMIFDKKYVGEWADVVRIKDSINRSSPGWRLPSAKEMKNLFYKTWDKRYFASSITASDCFTADWQTGLNDTDTVHVVGIMRGREFKAGLPYGANYAFFLVKEY